LRKFWLCLSLLLAGSLPSAHARGFIAPSTFPLGKSPGGSALADMNNDGILDLVNTFDSGSSGFSFDVSRGNGDGTFRPPIVTGEILGRSRGGFTVGDMNGDGNIDVLAYVEDGFAFILLGDGAGHLTNTFTRGLLGISPHFMLLADFNGDGKLDYAVTYADVTKVGVALGNGDGTFQNEKIFQAGPAPYKLAKADLNGDGKQDLAVAADSFPGGLYVLLGKGDGTFQPAITVDSATPLAGVTAVDLNLDGKMDLVAADTTFNIFIYLGNGDGTFQPGMSHPVGAQSFFVAAGDLNADGKPDLLVGKTSGQVVLFGNGDGTLQPGLDFATSLGSDEGSLGDVNNDGALDVITVDFLLNEAIVMLNNGDGTLHAARSFFISSQEQNGFVADMNGDKKPDAVVLTYFYSPGVSVAFGSGDGTVQPPIFTSVPNITTALAKGDFNNDGKIDLVVGQSNGTSDNILILKGQGNGTFTTGASYPVNAATTVATGDLNGDGKTDIVVASTSTQAQRNTVTVFLGNGNGTFTQKDSHAAGKGPKALVIANANQDGKLDVIVGDYSDTHLNRDLYVFLGNGDGTLQTPLISSVGGRIVGLAVGDFNKDGKNDLVANTAIDTQVRLGNGDGTFQQPKVIGAGGLGPIVGDVNADGKLDIILSASETTVWLGKGDGTFRAPLIYTTGDFMPIGIADFNGDMLPDLLTLNWSTTDITIVLNTP
jgi:FG-GAP-like repeat